MKPQQYLSYLHSYHIEEKNPLKQGLKLVLRIVFQPDLSDWREESIKTRIETTMIEKTCAYDIEIEEKNPLKQGLKQISLFRATGSRRIEEKNPLKQGLKQKIFTFTINYCQHWREESIKTRIETNKSNGNIAKVC